MKQSNTDAMSVLSALADRGVDPDRIEDGMDQLVGGDWKDLDAATWLSRLKTKGLVSSVKDSLHIDDLEALTRGKIILDDLYRRARHPEVFPITCSCGRSYSRAVWPLLHFDGIQTGYHELKRRWIFDDMEMRRCVCGSTMSVPLRLLKPE